MEDIIPHLEKAIQVVINESKFNLYPDKNLSRSLVKKRVWMIMNYRIDNIINKLIP